MTSIGFLLLHQTGARGRLLEVNKRMSLTAKVGPLAALLPTLASWAQRQEEEVRLLFTEAAFIFSETAGRDLGRLLGRCGEWRVRDFIQVAGGAGT